MAVARGTAASALRAPERVVVETAGGRLELAATHAGVCEVSWCGNTPRRMPERTTAPDHRALAHLRQAETELHEYLRGERREFTVPLDLGHRSVFTRQVLAACRRIPYGKTCSYGELAQQSGYPGAARAVGQVMARNPLPLLIPCHRVIRADGALGGFGRGLAVKRRLLRLEDNAIGGRQEGTSRSM
jgi:methylated-DNA-[protein]-cysteine S-methyltransferase